MLLPCSYLITGPSKWLNMIQGVKVSMVTKSTPSGGIYDNKLNHR